MRQHLIMSLMASLLLSACATTEVSEPRKTNTTEKAAGISPVKGTSRVVGMAAVHSPVRISIKAPATVINHKNRGKPALIAAVGGGLAGTDIDAYMDEQAKDLHSQLESEIEHGEITIERRNSDNALLIAMTPNTGFDNLSSVVKPGYLATLNKIAPVLNQYGKTMLTVIGYTDNVGPDARNQRLAERRARSVANYLLTQKLNSLRLQSYGVAVPPARADKNTVTGNQLKRRMEMWVQPVRAE